ncbi:MAG: hypothetical protein ABIP97_12480, partial [Chthoniobacterales bacterium]
DVAKDQESGLVRNRVESLRIGAQPLIATTTYTAINTEAAADTIEICRLPAGAQLLVSKWKVSTDGVGGTGAAVASLGTTGAASAYSSTSIAIVSVGDNAVTATNAEAVTNTVLAVETPILATLALSSGAFTAGKKITFRIEYLIP